MTQPDGLQAKYLQLAMAFGQGAHMMLADEEALLMAWRAYAQDLDRRAPEWNKYALQAIEYSRVMGSLAAQHALHHGRCVISAEDIEAALKAVRRNTAFPLGVCSITGKLEVESA